MYQIGASLFGQVPLIYVSWLGETAKIRFMSMGEAARGRKRRLRDGSSCVKTRIFQSPGLSQVCQSPFWKSQVPAPSTAFPFK